MMFNDKSALIQNSYSKRKILNKFEALDYTRQGVLRQP